MYPFQKAQNECFQNAIIELLKEEVAITEAMKVSVCFQAWSVHGMILNISVRVSFEIFEVSEQQLHETAYQVL